MELYTKVRIYDKVEPVVPRPKPMRLLCLGLSRTGTLSTYHALRLLGFNSYHFLEITQNRKNNHWGLWSEALRAKYDGVGKPWKGDDFDRILWNYDAVTDAPCCLFVDELIAAYPDAKVLLTTRDPQSWLASMKRTFLEVVSWRSWTILSWIDWEFSWPYWPLLNRVPAVWSRGKPAWKPSADAALLKSFTDHYDHVRAVVPKDRLLEFHPSEGWGPLCRFLDVESPEGDFPHINDGLDVVTIHEIVYWMRWKAVAWNATVGVGAAGVVAGVAWFWKTGQLAS